MITFIILSFLYLFLFPFMYLQILKRVLKKIARFRKIITSRNVAYKIHNAILGFITDGGALFKALGENIDTKLLIDWYYRLYRTDLVSCLGYELTTKSFDGAVTLLKKQNK